MTHTLFQVVGRNDDANVGRQVGNNIMEAYSKLKNLSGRSDGKSETMAKCKTLLALLCSEYDYDVINVSKMNAQVVIRYHVIFIDILAYMVWHDINVVYV